MLWGKVLFWVFVTVLGVLHLRLLGLLACMRMGWLKHSELRRCPWYLHLPQFERVADRLLERGFEEIGARLERTPALSVSARVFYSKHGRIYATLYSFLMMPRVFFATGFESGRMLFTGETDQKSRDEQRLATQRAQGCVETRLDAHLAAVKANALGGDLPTGKGSVAESIELARRFYSNTAA